MEELSEAPIKEFFQDQAQYPIEKQFNGLVLFIADHLQEKSSNFPLYRGANYIYQFNRGDMTPIHEDRLIIYGDITVVDHYLMETKNDLDRRTSSLRLYDIPKILRTHNMERSIIYNIPEVVQYTFPPFKFFNKEEILKQFNSEEYVSVNMNRIIYNFQGHRNFLDLSFEKNTRIIGDNNVSYFIVFSYATEEIFWIQRKTGIIIKMIRDIAIPIENITLDPETEKTLITYQQSHFTIVESNFETQTLKMQSFHHATFDDEFSLAETYMRLFHNYVIYIKENKSLCIIDLFKHKIYEFPFSERIVLQRYLGIVKNPAQYRKIYSKYFPWFPSELTSLILDFLF